MIEVIGVSFKKNSKIYYFSPNGLDIKKNSNVIVKTERGLQYGNVEKSNFNIDSKKLTTSLSEVVRIASKKDTEKHLKNQEDAKKALIKCRELVLKYNLNMYILEANYTFDRSQLLFTFLSESRVDFRKLAKDLANIYKTRIELRQVGVRELCCSKFLCDFDSVSINMAKNQNIALNPTKINGACGRLLCCLKYEDECYKECAKGLPKVGKKVETDEGIGKVISVDILKRKYKAELSDNRIIEVDLNESN